LLVDFGGAVAERRASSARAWRGAQPLAGGQFRKGMLSASALLCLPGAAQHGPGKTRQLLPAGAANLLSRHASPSDSNHALEARI
jgi:hypothetical protein